MSRRTPAAKDECVIARVTLALGSVKGRYDFSSLEVDSSDPESLVIVLSNDNDQRIRVKMARAEVKKHVSWSMLF